MTRIELLDRERGGYIKKWKGKISIALIYPNVYEVGMSNLGFQLVYRLCNERDDIVCERVFLPESGPPLSVESGRRLADFDHLFCSVSFEFDYVHIIQILLAGGIEPFSTKRRENESLPLIVCGGVATFMNPEPIADFVDLFLLGEAEPILFPVLDFLVTRYNGDSKKTDRLEFLQTLATQIEGVYVPALYNQLYDESGRFMAFIPDEGAPYPVRRQYQPYTEKASHSELLTAETEFSEIYLTELGRGCSRGCRFCAAGFIYRPPRLWDGDAVVAAMEERAENIDKVGLLGLEMVSEKNLHALATYLTEGGCALSFSSLRADRINTSLLKLLSESSLKSVAIAPDGASQRLREVINKNLDEKDLIHAAQHLVMAGIFKIKLYVMIGLPTETDADLEEFVELISKIKRRIDPIGQKRGRLTEMHLSVNCFVPKPWTPFQYHSFGLSQQLDSGEVQPVKDAVTMLKRKITFLKTRVKHIANVSFQADKPESALYQAVLSRGDRRLSEPLYDMASAALPWKTALKKHGLSPEQYVTTGFNEETFFPWYIVDHGIKHGYLWKEYKKGIKGHCTEPCDTQKCRRCGVCGGK